MLPSRVKINNLSRQKLLEIENFYENVNKGDKKWTDFWKNLWGWPNKKLLESLLKKLLRAIKLEISNNLMNIWCLNLMHMLIWNREKKIVNKNKIFIRNDALFDCSPFFFFSRRSRSCTLSLVVNSAVDTKIIIQVFMTLVNMLSEFEKNGSEWITNTFTHFYTFITIFQKNNLLLTPYILKYWICHSHTKRK